MGCSLPAGVEGVVGDLAGKPKPLLFGVVTNIAPPCVNTARLIYQVNDGTITSLDDVYDRGVALTLEGTYASEADVLDDGQEPSAGMYKVYLAGGLFRLGSSPAGTVTAEMVKAVSLARATSMPTDTRSAGCQARPAFATAGMSKSPGSA